jgi:hypothetical protein
MVGDGAPQPFFQRNPRTSPRTEPSVPNSGTRPPLRVLNAKALCRRYPTEVRRMIYFLSCFKMLQSCARVRTRYEARTMQHHWKREKVTVDRLRVGDLVDLAEEGCFEALRVPELDALRRVWPDHPVIRATSDERQNSPGVAPTSGVNITPTVGGIDQSPAGSLGRHAGWRKLFGRTSGC